MSVAPTPQKRGKEAERWKEIGLLSYRPVRSIMEEEIRVGSGAYHEINELSSFYYCS